MTDAGGVQKNTAYGVFVQACWAQHKRQYPDELIHKEIEEFNKQCSVWWYNLSEQERERFQEMADRSNAQQAAINQYQGQGQVVNAVVDNNGQVINYSTNPGGQVGVVRQVQGQIGIRPMMGQKVNQKPIKDPNAPKKPLSAYFLFSQEERLKVKSENPDLSITEVAKELGKRWATLDPALKAQYEQRYQEARKLYEAEMSHYKPQKKKKDPNAPKQPLSAYFIFSTEERLKVKEINPNFSICDIAKELGRRWADMDPALKQQYQARAEEERQKYDNDMATYRQGTLQQNHALNAENRPAGGSPNPNHPSPSPSPSYAQSTQPSATTTADYSNLLH